MTADSPSEAKQIQIDQDVKKLDSHKSELPKIIELLSKQSKNILDLKSLDINLRKLQAFKMFPEFVASQVAPYLVMERFSNGEVIEGGKKWFVCLHGSVAVSINRGNYVTSLVNQLHAGESFGEEALLSERMHQTCLTADGTVIVCRLERLEFIKFVLPGNFCVNIKLYKEGKRN